MPINREVLCCLELPPSHPLWDSLRATGFTVRRSTSLSQLTRQAADRGDCLVMAGPDLQGSAAARLAAQMHEAGKPLLLVVPAGCLCPPVPLGAPVYGYLPENAGPDQAAAALSVADQTFRYVCELKARLERLERQFEERKLVERAKGLLMAVRGLAEPEAHACLQAEAMRRHLQLTEVARSVIAAKNIP